MPLTPLALALLLAALADMRAQQPTAAELRDLARRLNALIQLNVDPPSTASVLEAVRQAGNYSAGSDLIHDALLTIYTFNGARWPHMPPELNETGALIWTGFDRPYAGKGPPEATMIGRVLKMPWLDSMALWMARELALSSAGFTEAHGWRDSLGTLAFSDHVLIDATEAEPYHWQATGPTWASSTGQPLHELTIRAKDLALWMRENPSARDLLPQLSWNEAIFMALSSRMARTDKPRQRWATWADGTIAWKLTQPGHLVALQAQLSEALPDLLTLSEQMEKRQLVVLAIESPSEDPAALLLKNFLGITVVQNVVGNQSLLPKVTWVAQQAGARVDYDLVEPEPGLLLVTDPPTDPN